MKTAAPHYLTRISLGLFFGATGLLTASASAGEIQFNRDIRPILSDRCFQCHGPGDKDRKAHLRLDQPDGEEGAYRTHDNVTAIAPNDLEKSELWYRITTDDEDDVMPPPKAHKKPLSANEKALIKQWITEGAKYEQFWAFVPAKMPVAPEVKDKEWGRQPIDAHVLGKLESKGLSPSEEADKRTLIRRVSFDLTGLPPTREEIAAILADEDPKAYEKLVDQLLAKPQFGEHLARYWLDLVRFADTNGMHKDFYRDNTAYRDWVIRAFNDDIGYDDFVRYQLAGDLFPDASNDQLVASAFNRLHLIIDRGTALPEESFFKNITDRTTAVGTAFMGLTVHCSSCHDHKYDPLTQKDFYSLFAFFNNIDAQPETNGGEKGGLQPPTARIGTVDQMKNLGEIAEQLAKLKPDVDKEKINVLTKQRAELEKAMPLAMVMKERGEVRPTHLMVRGQYDAPGEEVTRNTPGFLPPMKKSGEIASRMDLAEWFVAPENPLTARVAVNRFWQQLFGVGLVKTSEDFGAQGEVPSHPELLDYLTVTFVTSGWHVKPIMKEIVLSNTYRQSSVTTPERFKTDPENRLLARGSRFRMDAEMIRDQVLATSGLLSPTMFGKSVKPPQPDGLWKAVTMIGERFKPDTGESIYRRSVYTYWKRGMPPPQMTILNAPIRDSCIARRERTNTPSQALLLLNEAEYLKAARSLGQKLIGLQGFGKPPSFGIAYAYEVVTSHVPDEKEMKSFIDLAKKLDLYYAEHPELAEEICSGIALKSAAEKTEIARWTVIVNTLYNLDITKTRQ